MSFLLRPVEDQDADQLVDLAKQFVLINLPADKSDIKEKIACSKKSFAGELPKESCEYIFALEDTEMKNLVGTSLVVAKHGTEKSPHHSFKILKKNRFSQSLGIGFIHQVLRFQSNSDGPSEIGGLLVDRHYRRRPEKLGHQISLVRFLYMGMFPEKFEKRILCELAPPLGEGGRSEFWEALGRRFTGLPYQEADQLSQENSEFITSLFPEEDIYMNLLESKARLLLGRIGLQTKPAQRLIEKLGFTYTNEVDPFDGGPHYACDLENVELIKTAKWSSVDFKKKAEFKERVIVSCQTSEGFRAITTVAEEKGEKLLLPISTEKLLKISSGEKVFYSKFI